MKFAFCEGTDILGLTECYSQFLSDVLHMVFQINPLRENGFFSSVSGQISVAPVVKFQA